MNRLQTIQHLIAMRGCKKYLEIGCADDLTFKHVKIEKVGVDPTYGGNRRMTSDQFFAQAGDARFDLVFIDGWHHHDQAFRDVENALDVLSPGGCILMHDCLPPNERYEGLDFCGTVWRAFAKLRTRAELDGVCGDYDFGVGVILPRQNSAPVKITQSMDELTYAQFVENRAAWMRPCSFEGLLQFAMTGRTPA